MIKQLQILLNRVGLPHLTDKLQHIAEWHKLLSGDEQQRISIARALLHRPTLILLDEVTNQLDDSSAVQLMQLLQTELPNTLCLAVSHQTEVKALFEKTINL